MNKNQSRRPYDLEFWLFINLIGHVYLDRLCKVKEQLRLANQSLQGFAGKKNKSCKHAFTSVYGLPYSHLLIASNLERKTPLVL